MRTTKSVRSDRNRKVIAGLRKHYASTPTMILDGVSHATADVVTAFQGTIDLADATAAAAATFHKAVSAERTARDTTDGLYGALKTVVISQFKTSPDTLADFGITLTSRRAPDVVTKAGAAEKGRATRAARHTMGKRQKAKVTGATASAGPAPAGPAPAATAQPPSVPVTKP
jgi:hypothetical protein